MLTFKITSLKYFVKITKWIFLESTRKGLLKNVQDRISKPLGGREIQKTKVYTVLLDTLYFDASPYECS